MLTLHPLQAMLPQAVDIDKIIAPPYDVVTRDEVKGYVEHNPYHFLNVTRPDGVLDKAIAFDDARVYQAAHDNWQRLMDEGIFTQDDAPHYYVYAMTQSGHKQYGVVALTSVLDYKNGIVRRHELTRPDKENDRVRHIQAVNGQLSPVLLAVKDTGEIAQLLETCAQNKSVLSADLNGVTHELWVVPQDQEAKLQDLFQAQDLLYVADGHHRTAAALRAYEASGENPYCLSVIFPSQHMKICGYHRVVADLNGLSEADFLEQLKSHFDVASLASLTYPAQHGVCHMVLGNEFFRLTRKDRNEQDPVLSLDVSALSRFVLTPMLGIQDIRTDQRIGFVGGDRALDVIRKQVQSGEAAVGFLMTPTQMDELLHVADASELMPPKSTWFEPKLADGLFVYTFD